MVWLKIEILIWQPCKGERERREREREREGERERRERERREREKLICITHVNTLESGNRFCNFSFFL